MRAADRCFPGPTPQEGELDASRLEQILGHAGRVQGKVFKISIGRRAEMGRKEFGASMGLTTWMAFSGRDELAAVAGDFAMTAGEVQSVLKALRNSKISVVALHNHMLGESPPIYVAHFWGKGPANAQPSVLVIQRTTSTAPREDRPGPGAVVHRLPRELNSRSAELGT